MIELFTEALKATMEENSEETILVRKAAKAQEREKPRKWCGKTKGVREFIREVSSLIGL